MNSKNTVVKHTRSIVYTRAVPRALDKANCRWLELYLGYFQYDVVRLPPFNADARNRSVRPTVGHLMVNIDTTYGLMSVLSAIRVLLLLIPSIGIRVGHC